MKKGFINGMSGMIRRLAVFMAAVLMVSSLLAGCGSKPDTDVEEPETEETEEEETSEKKKPKKPKDDDEVTEPEEQLTMPKMAASSNIWEVAGHTIIFGNDMIASYDEKSGESEILWKNEEMEDDFMSVFSSGTGLVLGDRIYFGKLRSALKNGSWTQILYVYSMKLDGSELEVINKTDDIDNASWGVDLAYADDILYVSYYNYSPPVCIKLDKDGKAIETVDYTELKPYALYDPDSYSMPSIKNNGANQVFPAISSSEFGKVMFAKNYNTLVVGDANTEETEEYTEQIVMDINGSKVLLYHYNDTVGKNEYSLLDVVTGDFKKLWNGDYVEPFAMDDDYVYLYSDYTEDSEDEGACTFYKRSLTTGEKTVLYQLPDTGSALPSVSSNIVAASYKDGKLYALLNRDYALSIVRVDTSNDEATVLVDRFYDSGISEIGELVTDSTSVMLNDDIKLASSYSSILHLKSSIGGADKINKDMDELAENIKQMAEDSREECTEWYKESEGYFIPYEFTTTFGSIAYYDNGLLNIIQDSYEYFGGAHGMPYMRSFIYDPNTGDRKTLRDLISLSEEELDELLVRYTTDHMNDIGESYWDGYEDTVKEYTGLDEENFYLTEDGIVFYYPPYALTSFAGGFQEVEVPDRELGVTFR